MATLAPDDPHNQKVGKEPKFDKYPHCIYFYYIGELDSDGYNPIFHYYYPGDKTPIDPAGLQTKIRALITNAKDNDLPDQLPPSIGENWKFVVWERISYIVFAIDIPGIVLGPKQLAFTQQPNSTYNWSFFDAQPATLIDGCTVITCINHMKADSAFKELEYAKQYFHFDLQTDPELQWPKDRYPDSGGTNMGPPIGPP